MDYREMATLAKDPPRVRALAEFILVRSGRDLPDGLQGFLAELARYDGSKPLSLRRLETLYALRERASHRSKVGGYRAAALIKAAWESRFDLVDEVAEAWLDELNGRGRGQDLALSRAEWRRLFALCRKLGILHPGEWVGFE
jgi:hypothetical protein